MNNPKGILTGDRPINSAGILNSDWAVSFGTIGDYEFIGASSVRGLSSENKFFRNNSFVMHLKNDWLIVNLAESQQKSFSQVVAYKLCQEILKRLNSVKPNDLPAINLKEESTNQLINKNHMFFKLPFPLKVEEYERLNLNNDYIVAGSLYGYDQNGFAEGKETTKINVKDLEKIIRHSFESTRLSIEKEKLQLLSSTSALSLVFNTKYGIMMNGMIGNWGIGCIGSNDFKKYIVTDKEEDWHYAHLNGTENWEDNLKFFSLTMSKRKTLILFNNGICRDIAPNSIEMKNTFVNWAKELEYLMEKEGLLEDKSRTILQWLANYKLFEIELDKTLFIMRKIGNKDIEEKKKEKTGTDNKNIKIKNIPKIQTTRSNIRNKKTILIH